MIFNLDNHFFTFSKFYESIDWLEIYKLTSVKFCNYLLDKLYIFFNFFINSYLSLFYKYLERRPNLWSNIPYKSAFVFLAWPEGNITIPESIYLPFIFNFTEVGIPSGYLLSYSGPPCLNVILLIIFLVSWSKIALCE